MYFSPDVTGDTFKELKVLASYYFTNLAFCAKSPNRKRKVYF